MAKSTDNNLVIRSTKDGKTLFSVNGVEYATFEEYKKAIHSPALPKKPAAPLNYSSAQLKDAINRVWDAYSNDDLKSICAAAESDFDWAGEYHATPSQSYYYYKRNGASVLAVAHLDSVQRGREAFKVSSDGMRVWSPVLDDRLGVYTITKLLPALGIVTDILLTTGEETGASTAKEFGCPVIYNWMVEFDRGGGDAVTYQYNSEQWESMLESYGYEVGHGIYSDIDDLGHVGCSAVNIGVGYQRYHSADAYFDLPVYIRNVARFLLMHEAQQAQMFYHSAPKYKYGRYSRYDYYDADWHKPVNTVASLNKSTVGTESLPAIPAKPIGDLSDIVGSETDNNFDEDVVATDEVRFGTGDIVYGWQIYRDLSIESPESNSSQYQIASTTPFIMENLETGVCWEFDESTWGWKSIESIY